MSDTDVVDGKVDCSQKERGVWLVKVPKYLSEHWQKTSPGQEVAKLKVLKNNDVVLETTAPSSSSSFPGRVGPSAVEPVHGGPSGVKRAMAFDPLSAASAPSTLASSSKKEVPPEHRFVIGDLHNQCLALFSEEDTTDPLEPDLKRSRICLEGRVVKRAECRPPRTTEYMKMKVKQIEEVSKPTRAIKTMEKATVKFKPILQHKELAIREKQKKEGKNVRLDREILLERLYSAFEKHQYYKLTDLASLTHQPPNYVKELLTEIGIYNHQPPHKAMWELKPEYRHFKSEDGASGSS